MDPYKAIIDYEAKTARLAIGNGFVMPFKTRTRLFPCIRKVKTTRAVTLLPNQEAFVAVDYYPLPAGRPLMFNSRHPAALNAVIDAKTPRVVALKNPSKGMLTIPKRYPIGRIEESEDSGFLACSWDSAFIALTVATALTAMATPAVATDVDSTALAIQSSLPSVATEFNVDHRVQAIIDGPSAVLGPYGGIQHIVTKDSSTPLSDYVFNITQSTGATTGSVLASRSPTCPTDVLEQAKAVVPEKISTLGIKVPTDVLEVTTEEGIRVYSPDRKTTRKFVALVKKYLKLWTDQGIVDIAEEDMMHIPLVEGWQHQKVRSRQYPLSHRDREVLDSIFDELHRQDRMTWATKATPFAHLVFVVW